MNLGYQFRDPDLLKLALMHRSYLSVSGEKNGQTNERLEFLGDAILGFLVTEYLFHRYPNESEGILTEYKSAIVSRKTLAHVAEQISLGQYLYLGYGEARSGGRVRHSNISNALEAVLGAIYLDGGFIAVKLVINRLILTNLEQILQSELNRNYKSQLLEYTQSKGLGLPEYVVQSERGPEHNKIFEVAVQIQGKIVGVGSGKSKKKAEQNAAQQAMNTMT